MKLISENSVNPVSFNKEGFTIEAKNKAAGVCSTFKIKNPQSVLESSPTLTLYNDVGEYQIALTPIIITENIKQYEGSISKAVSIKDSSWVITGELNMNITVTLSKRKSENSDEENLVYDLQYNLEQLKRVLAAIGDDAGLVLKEIFSGVLFVGAVFFVVINSA